MAAALRALLRRRAATPPSLALLQTLFPGRFSTPPSPLLPAAAVGLPDVRRPQPSPVPVPPLLRYYSSKPSGGLKLLIDGQLEELIKQFEVLIEALEICDKARDLLRSEGWDDESVAMFENGLEKAIKSLDVCDKVLDDLFETFGSSNARAKDILELFQMLIKESVINIKRRELKNTLVTLKKRKKFYEGITAVIVGTCFVQLVMIVVRFYYNILSRILE